MSILYMTLADMRGQVGRFVGDTTSGSSLSRSVKIDEALNTNYADIVTRFRWPQLCRGSETTLAFTSGNKFLYLPKDVQELFFIIRGAPIEEAPHQTIESFFRRQLETVDTAGRFVTHADAGEFGRRAEFSTTAEKLVIQNVGAGADAQTIIIHGKLRVGTTEEEIEVIESVALTTGTAVVSTNTYSNLIQVSASGSQTGYIDVTGNTSGTRYATIEPGERTARYKRLRVGYTPDNSDTYTLYFKKAVRRLTADNQTPEIPVSHAMIEMTIGQQFMLERKWQGAGTVHIQRAEEMLMNLMAQDLSQGNRIEQAQPYVGRRNSGRGSDTIVVSNG